MLEKTILREYQKNIFYCWKSGPKFWNGYDIDLEKLSNNEFIEEFIFNISDSPQVHTDEDIDWDLKFTYLDKAIKTFSKFLNQHPEQVARMRRG